MTNDRLTARLLQTVYQRRADVSRNGGSVPACPCSRLYVRCRARVHSRNTDATIGPAL